MRVEALIVDRFRSINHVQIADCGAFNVLIGKNNSGKSNILSAIDAFFGVLRQGDLLTIKSPVERVVDFHEQDTQLPISVNVRFVLDDHSRTALLSNVVSESPQMRNAVDALEAFSRLSVTIAFTPPPQASAYVSSVRLCATADCEAKHRELLAVGPQTVAELYARATRIEELSKDAKALSALPERVPKEFLFRSAEQKVPPRYFMREIAADVFDSAFERLVDTLVKESETSEEFIRAARSQAAKWDEEASALNQKQLTNPISTFAGLETVIPRYITQLLQRLASINILHLQERRKPIGREEAGRLLELKMSRGGPAVLRNLQETVSTLLGVQIDAFRSDTPSVSRGDTGAELDVDNFLVQVNGAGVREALRVILDYEFRKPDILLVEEPEIHLHPGLETSMMRYLRRISANTQVFLTTHSTNFLDTAAVSNVYLISKPSATQIQALDLEQAESRLPEELGLRMSSLFLYDRLVFVEGRTDEGVIREWASTLGTNLPHANVGFVHMGGARNFAYYAAERTLSFLTKRNVRCWFLLDRDDREDAEIQKLQGMFDSATTVKFLQRREIENYLVSAPALVRFIKWKRAVGSSSSDEPDELAVQNAIAEGAVKLKEIAVCKRVAKRACVPVYPSLKQLTEEADEQSVADRVRHEIDRMIAELTSARDAVDLIVSEQTTAVAGIGDESYASIVPGDLLLDAICTRFGVRFKKEKDSIRMASFMHADEIDEEIKAIIRSFAAG